MHRHNRGRSILATAVANHATTTASELVTLAEDAVAIAAVAEATDQPVNIFDFFKNFDPDVES